jgi:hypothetical protein
MNYREEIANMLTQRGMCLKDGDDLPGTVRAFAEAVSLCYDNKLWKNGLSAAYWRWEGRVRTKVEASAQWRGLKEIRVIFPRRRRYPGLSAMEEKDIIRLEIWEQLLDNRAFMQQLSKSSNLRSLVIECRK